MWPYVPALLERPVPRYTSYPTAAEFAPIEPDFHGAGLDGIAPESAISLYAHIPFCERICWYCGCNTGAANRAQRLTAYLDALHAEIEIAAGRLDGHHPVSQIAFGGGSPNAIPAVDFVRLLDHLTIAFGAPAPRISIELDPRSLTAEWIGVLGRAGVSHASMGVQTFDPALQARIGRIQPAEMIERAMAGLREQGVGSINFDLMYGLPGQGLKELEDTLDRTIALGADRIALFGYAHLPERIPRQRQIDGGELPGSRMRFDMAAFGHEKLAAAGYRPIGFDHFALPGDPLARAAEAGRLHRNFQGFTDDATEVLVGMGASAISSFPDRFVQNEKNGGRYRMMSSAGRLSGTLGIMRGPDDRRRGAIIEGLLCHGRADLAGFAPSGEIVAGLEPFRREGLIEIDGEEIRLTPAGLPYGRVVACLFDRYRQPGQPRFSSAI